MQGKHQREQSQSIKRSIANLACATLIAISGSGCVVAAIGAGVGAWKYGSAKQREAYTEYRNETERINLEREQSGLEPRPIMTFDEWMDGSK